MKVRVSDVMTSEVIVIGPDALLKDAAVTMARHRISGLPVVADGRLVGIVTESDFVARLAEEGSTLLAALFRRQRGQEAGLVSEAMTPDPVTVAPDEPVAAAARLMTRHNVKRLPVVDRHGTLIGVVSRADLMEIFARPDDAIAADVRSGGVVGLIGADTGEVGVLVADGVVRLVGKVGTVTERRILEEFSRHVAGVVRVDSDLEADFDDTRLPPS